MVREETVDLALKIAVPVGLFGLGAYVVYKLVNPSPNCTTPGTACYSAIQPYQTELNVCASQLADLSAQLITQAQAPTASQQFLMQSLVGCMDNAAKNASNVAAGFKQPSLNDFITYIGDIGIIVAVGFVVGKYVLPGLGTFLANRRSGGQVSTPASGGAGIATVVLDGFVQYAVSQGLITSALASAWGSALSSLSASNLADVRAFWPSLEALNLISASVAASEVSLLTSSLNLDLATTYATLGLPPPPPLPMERYAQLYETYNPPPLGDCGCQ